MTIDKGQIIIQAGIHRPDTGFRVILLIVSIQQGNKVNYRFHKIKADGAAHVGCTAERRELPGISFYLPGNVPDGSYRNSEMGHINPADSPMGKHVSLTVGKGVPVTENLGAVAIPPDKIKTALLFEQPFGTGGLSGKML